MNMETNTETKPAVGEASYNITDDRLKVWFNDRLPPDEYAKFKAAGFVWWRGSKCLTCVWRPGAEDLIKKYGIEIEEDDSPDDTEARVERFGRYAQRHLNNAESADNYRDSDRCNTDRRRRNALNAAERGYDTAAYWNRRIQGSISHAERKEDPGVVMRRIEKLETELRDRERKLSDATKRSEFRGSNPSKEQAMAFTNFHDHTYVACKDGFRRSLWGCLDDNKLTLEEAISIGNRSANADLTHATRWIEHLNMRLTYERALLAASGDVRGQILSNEIQLEAGGAVQMGGRFVPGRTESWKFIYAVNPKTLDIWSPTHWGRNFHRIERNQVTAYKTPDEVKAGDLDIDMPPADVLAKVGAPKTVSKDITKDGKRPEKWGAVGICGGYSQKIEDAEWCLIIKVNAKTLDCVYRYSETIFTDGKEETRDKLVKKTEYIYHQKFLKTAAEAAQVPELMELKARVEAIEARKKERKAAEKAGKAGDV